MILRLLPALCISLVWTAHLAGALVTINTNDPGQVALFQLDAKVQTFESLPGQNTESDGTAIVPASQLDNQLKQTEGIFFTSGGNTPIAVLDLTKLDTARSGKNVVAPLEINSDLLCARGTSCFMEVFFTGANNKFGAWFDQGDARMIIFWTDNTSDVVDVVKGRFAGGADTDKTIDHITLFARNGGPLLVDDLTYGGSGTPTPTPEPTTLLSMGAALLVLGYLRKRAR
jgi:hypothetical protein